MFCSVKPKETKKGFKKSEKVNTFDLSLPFVHCLGNSHALVSNPSLEIQIKETSRPVLESCSPTSSLDVIFKAKDMILSTSRFLFGITAIHLKAKRSRCR